MKVWPVQPTAHMGGALVNISSHSIDEVKQWSMELLRCPIYWTIKSMVHATVAYLI